MMTTSAGECEESVYNVSFPPVHNYKTTVYAKLQVEGIHAWYDCPHDEVKYLTNEHRHWFHIKAEMRVYHNDRDKEFIMLQHEIRDYLHSKYYHEPHKCLFFGAMSCEMIAEELLDNFSALCKVEVSEDDENGAIVERIAISD